MPRLDSKIFRRAAMADSAILWEVIIVGNTLPVKSMDSLFSFFKTAVEIGPVG